jgi:hypothetical protein
MLGTVNENPVELSFEGRYAIVDLLKSGDLVTFTFPISERTINTAIGNEAYTLVIKGNDVVSIKPSGILHPLYQREKYRENQARWVKRDRFVPAT